MLPAGKYYIGDLCYVMHEEWNEFCDITMPNMGEYIREGEFSLKDGREFGFSCTAYGDGSYHDQNGAVYGVDAGLIGCIKVSDISESDQENLYLGNVVEFPEPFDVTSDDGVITIGHIVIDTN